MVLSEAWGGACFVSGIMLESEFEYNWMWISEEKNQEDRGAAKT